MAKRSGMLAEVASVIELTLLPMVNSKMPSYNSPKRGSVAASGLQQAHFGAR